jgi:hypothetical protein
VSYRKSEDNWIDGALDIDPDQDVDFETGLPQYTEETTNKRRVIKKSVIPLGEGKYRDELDFEAGLTPVKAKVRINKAAAEANTPEEIERAPVRIHKGPKLETHVSTSDNGDVKPTKVVPKLDPHVHSFTVEGTQVFTSSGKANKESHYHTVKIGSSTYQTSLAKESNNHTHSIKLDGKSISSSGPAKGKKKEPSKKSSTPILEIGLPEVLSWEAVRTGKIPDLGESGLPESLEDDVPPRFRYWKCESVEDSILVRNALVEEQIFTPETIKSVNGELRRAVIETVQKLYLSPCYDNEDTVEVPEIVRPIEKVSRLLEASSDDKSTVLFDEEIVEAIGIETILKRADRIDGDYIICAYDTPDLRKSIEGSAFRLKSRDDLVFITNAKIADESMIEWVQFERSTELVKFAFREDREIRFFKSLDAEEERTVFGIVLEPEEVDAQGDIISEEEIKQACHKFMEDFGNLGLQHKEIVNGKLKLLENYIAPVNFKVDKQSVKKGSWLMKERVVDDELWKASKGGKLTGFSIGGSGIRRPVK